MAVGKRVIIFKRAKEINIEQALILDDAMKEARENYIQVYKDRFKNQVQLRFIKKPIKFCLDSYLKILKTV